MRRGIRISLGLAASLILLGISSLAALYFSKSAAVVTRLCQLGLPNITMPSRFRDEAHSHERCVSYGVRTRFSGIWWTDGFENSGFFPYRFTEEAIVRHGIGYEGAQLQLDQQSDPKRLVEKFWRGSMQGSEVFVIFEGWPSVSEGQFGHLGAHNQQILVDRVISAAPAPEPTDADYLRWRRMLETQR